MFNNREEWISNRTTGISEDEIYNREHYSNIYTKFQTKNKNAMYQYTVLFWISVL